MSRRTVLASGVAGATAVALHGCALTRGTADELRQRFLQRVAEIERGTRGRLGVTILDTATDAHYAWRGDERFPMCSTAKLGMVATLLDRVDAGKERLDRRVVYASSELVTYSPTTQPRVGGDGMSLEELCEAAMVLSDNSAANFLMRSYDGPKGFTDFFRRIGDTVTRLDRWETELNTAIPGDDRDTTTPNAMARSVKFLTFGDVLTAKSRHRLMTWLLGNKVGDMRMRAGVSDGWLVADKTGTGEFGTTNDIGVLLSPKRAPMVVACYLTEAEAIPGVRREAALADVARLATSLF